MSEITFFTATKKGGCCSGYCDGSLWQDEGRKGCAIPPWRRGSVVKEARMMSPGSDRWSRER